MSATTTVAMNGLLNAEYFDLRSELVGDCFRIFVATPAGLQQGKYPVVYLADGNGAFPLAMAIQRLLAWGGEIPPAFVVGVGYPTEAGYASAVAKRNRDYVPTEGGAYARAVLRESATAGASAFLRFLIEELKPTLQERYPIDSEDATFFGSSLAGLFGAWTLLNAPSTFQKYILASPTISWNDEEVWDWEQSYSVEQQDLPASVFVSAGSLETAEEGRKNALEICAKNPLLRSRVEGMIAWFDEHGWPRTTELAPEFVDRLRARNYPRLKIHCHNMPDETHMSVPPAVLSRGLRYVFNQWQPA
jgi:hypothetical protein